MRIGILVAMDKELRELQKVFCSNNLQASHTRRQILVQKCGIGKVNAALGAQNMINTFHPDAIISSGCAGGNGQDVNPQDVIVSTQITYHDVYCGTAEDGTAHYGQVLGLPTRYDADPQLLAAVEKLSANASLRKGIKIHKGLIVTGDWFVDTKEKMLSIVEHFPEAKAVDMESCAIAQTCYINKVPFISFRVISDVPLKDTNASQYHNFWETLAQNSFEVTRTFVEAL